MTRTLPQSPADIYDVLLMEYATGGLCDTLSLLMASHVTLSPQAQRHVSIYESLGGALMDGCCEPVAMLESSLISVLSQLESFAAETPCAALMQDFGCTLPQPLSQHMAAQACSKKKWRRARPHTRVMEIPLPHCNESRAFLVQITSGTRLPRHRRAEREYTLVLEGHLLQDHATFSQGDLLIIDATAARPVAAQPHDCLCLVIADMPQPRRSRWLAQVFPLGW